MSQTPVERQDVSQDFVVQADIFSRQGYLHRVRRSTLTLVRGDLFVFCNPDGGLFPLGVEPEAVLMLFPRPNFLGSRSLLL